MQSKCPKCGSDLVLRIARGVDILHCVGCSGLWFDKDKLEQILARGGRRNIRAISLENVDMSPEGARDWKTLWYDEQEASCPRCWAQLERRESLDKQDLFLDFCDGCGGVWFDGGEVDDLLIDGAKTPTIKDYLRELFVRKDQAS